MRISMLTKKKRITSRTKSANALNAETGVSRMLFTMVALRRAYLIGNGANTKARILTSPTSTSVSPSAEIPMDLGSTSKESGKWTS